MGRSRGPGIATANRRRGGDFSALIGRMSDDPDALDGLLYAYESMDVADRERLARAILQDLEEPSGVLSLLFMVEDDPTMKRQLFAWLATERVSAPWAALDGTDEAGEASLIRPGLNGQADTMRIRWDHYEIRSIDVETLTYSSLRQAQPVPTDVAVDLLAPLVWRFVRGNGALPEGAHRFAGFFAASPRA